MTAMMTTLTLGMMGTIQIHWIVNSSLRHNDNDGDDSNDDNVRGGDDEYKSTGLSAEVRVVPLRTFDSG